MLNLDNTHRNGSVCGPIIISDLFLLYPPSSLENTFIKFSNATIVFVVKHTQNVEINPLSLGKSYFTGLSINGQCGFGQFI